jgi:hypothetical protein
MAATVITLPPMTAWLVLAIQALFAVIGLRLLVRRVLPALHGTPHVEIFTDVWGPLTIVGPMLFLAVRVRDQVTGIGWLAVDGPLLIALMGAGMAMTRRGIIGSPAPRPDAAMKRGIVTAACAAIFLLLLGAAHDLTLWMGQCAFAVGAVLLWINTPLDRLTAAHNQQNDAGAGLAITAAAPCALIQGLAMLHADDQTRLSSGALAIVSAAVVLAAAARISGPAACLRLAMWSAALGVFFGIGLISLMHMLPEAIRAIRTGEAGPVHRVARGFGAFAPEASALLLVCAFQLVHQRLRSQYVAWIGIAALMAASAAVVWRLIALTR